jgi:phospholipase/carboxylesterase
MTTPLLSLRSPGFTSEPAYGRPVLLLLHGYGSNEHDLTGIVPALGLTLPWASLRAPFPSGNGAAWFEVHVPGNPAEQPVADATDAIWEWVEANVRPETRVIPIGFSQGGLMASQLLRTRPERVLATVVLGGFVLGAPQPADARLLDEQPPAFWGRGVDDRVMTVAAVERTAEFLPNHTSLTERVYPGLAHGINVAELADVRAFLTMQPLVEPQANP